MGVRTGQEYIEGLRDGRQALYERFFAGDPINNRILHYGTDRRKDCEALARRLLEADRQE